MAGFDTALGAAALIAAGGATYVAASSTGGSGDSGGGSGGGLGNIISEIAKTVQASQTGAGAASGAFGAVGDAFEEAADITEGSIEAVTDGNVGKTIDDAQQQLEDSLPDGLPEADIPDDFSDGISGFDDVGGGLMPGAPGGPLLEGGETGDIGKWIGGGIADNVIGVLQGAWESGGQELGEPISGAINTVATGNEDTPALTIKDTTTQYVAQIGRQGPSAEISKDPVKAAQDVAGLTLPGAMANAASKATDAAVNAATGGSGGSSSSGGGSGADDLQAFKETVPDPKESTKKAKDAAKKAKDKAKEARDKASGGDSFNPLKEVRDRQKGGSSGGSSGGGIVDDVKDGIDDAIGGLI